MTEPARGHQGHDAHLQGRAEGAADERLDRPDKYYKYNPGDVDERSHWPSTWRPTRRSSTRPRPIGAPWYVVPADHKWYARLAVQQLLLEALRAMNLEWPPADFDVEVEQKRLAES